MAQAKTAVVDASSVQIRFEPMGPDVYGQNQPQELLAAIAAMLAGSVVGLLAYVLIAPYCAAVFSAAVSAVVMLIGSRRWPERFDFTLLQEEG